MILILLEREVCVDSVIDKLAEKYPVSSVLHVRGWDAPVNSRPLLTGGWLVVVSSISEKKVQDVVNKFVIPANENDVVVLQLTSSNDFISKILLGHGVAFKFYNNLNVEKEALVNYCMRELVVSKKLASSIVARVGKYEPLVIGAVELLKCVPKVTSQVIARYVKDRGSSTNFFNFYNYIIFGNIGMWVGDSAYRLCVRLVEEYRYSPKTLIRFIDKQLDKDYNYFTDILDGKLHRDNVSDYARISNVPLSEVSRALEKFCGISFDSLVVIRSWVKSQPVSVWTLMHLLYSKRVGGMCGVD
jgi:hypothetical protein